MIIPNIYVWLDQNSYICDLETAISTSHRFISKEEAAIARCDCGDPLSSGAACARRGSQTPICVKLPELCMREYAILFTPAENRLLQPITTTPKTTTQLTTTTTTTATTTTTTTRRTTKAPVPFQQRPQLSLANRRPQFGLRERPPQRRPFPTPNPRQNRPFFTLAPRFPQNFQQRSQGQRRGTIEQDFFNFRNVNPRLRNGRLRGFTTVVPIVPQQRRNLPFRQQQQPPRQNRPRPPPLPTLPTPETVTPVTTTSAATTTAQTTTTPTTTVITTTRPSTTSPTTTTTTVASITTTLTSATQTGFTVGSQTVDQLMQLLIARLLAATNSKNGDPAAALMSLMEKNGIEVPREIKEGMREEIEGVTPVATSDTGEVQNELSTTQKHNATTSPVEVSSGKPQEKVAMFSDTEDAALHQRVVFSTQMDIGDHNVTPIQTVTSPSPQVTSPSPTSTVKPAKTAVVPSSTSSSKLGKLPIQHRLDSDVTKPKKVNVVTSPVHEVTTTKEDLVSFHEAPEKQQIASNTIFASKRPEEKLTMTSSEKPVTSPGTIWATSRQSPVISSVQRLMAVQQPSVTSPEKTEKKKLSPGTIWMRNFIEENLRSLWQPSSKPVTGEIEDSRISNFIEHVEAPVISGRKAPLQKTSVTQPSKSNGKDATVVTSSAKPVMQKRPTVSTEKIPLQVTPSERPTVSVDLGVEEIPLDPAPMRTTLKPVRLVTVPEKTTVALELTAKETVTSSEIPPLEVHFQKTVEREVTTTVKPENRWIERSRVNKTQPSQIEVVRLIPEVRVTSVVQQKPHRASLSSEEATEITRRPVKLQRRPPTVRPRTTEPTTTTEEEKVEEEAVEEEREEGRPTAEVTSSPSKISVSTESLLTIGKEGFSSVSLIQQKLDNLENQLMGVLTDKLSALDDFDNFERNDINPFPPRRRTNHRQRQLSEDGFSLDSGLTTVDKDEAEDIPKMQEVLDMKGMKFKTSPFNPKICEDNHPLCEYWAFYKQCRMNSPYMYKFCRKACKICE